MFALLVIVLFGLLFSYLAGQNTFGVPVHIFNYQWNNIPLYLVALLSLLIGIALSWGLSIVNWTATTFTLMGKNTHIKKTEAEIALLQRTIHELKEENTALRNQKGRIRSDTQEKIAETKQKYPRRSFFDRFHHIPSV
jgi:FtsZ-binding cell division protein ZapB